jgi:protein-S-isoprenylcysteine O-methyltransferase Ste14
MNRLSLYLLIWCVRVSGAGSLLWLFYFLHFGQEGSGGSVAMVYNAVLLISWSTLHSLLARERIRAVIARITGPESVRAVYVIFSGVTLVFVLCLWQPLSGTLWAAQGAGYWILTAMFLACIGGAYYAGQFFDGSEFIGIRVFLRKLQDKPPKEQRFSAEGPYAHCRHPMYLFFLASLWVGPTMTYGRLEFAAIGTLYVIIGTFLEERNLSEELGADYERYRANVPMWVPRLSPWRYE